MAHEIENRQIAYTGEVPWHGIGARMGDGQSSEEWLKAANLDWKVGMRQTYFKDVENDTMHQVPNSFALVRETDNKVLTVASSRWTPLQNSDMLDFMQRYVTAGGATLETVGALRDGKIIWALAKLKHDFEIRPGDRIGGYLLFQSPHQVGKAISVSTTTIRVVCANTMAAARRNQEINYRQSHLNEFDVEAARESVALAHSQLAEAEKRWLVLDKLKLSTDDIVKKVLAPVYAPSAKGPEDSSAIMGILTSIAAAPGYLADQKETGYGVLNGVTHWSDHVRGRGGAGRLKSIFSGDSHKQKLEVESRLLELV